ncbi:alpha/beta fold hydrolase [Nocardia farcinica]|uniref:alpha/beta fold hydrolase n=1 Tax=Nocardia farcinica TaxID=37329 RepID=UPI001895BE55|nr:alpha/beta hydrolase [Nocardia farcinica]MBF6420919.1 alpha/beta fold hydrolase [Nocardia farcinica]MBF6432622.1 alpha/beta fold hydrolase [Nocardia farcinica]MBF6503121.1 alpha/beta fold hydrolase [Nocardia farcinica]
MLNTYRINGVEIGFDDQGYAPDRPAIVLLPGWGHDHRAFDRMLPHLRPHHRVIRVCWRGHGIDRTLVGDFGVAEQVSDTIGLLDALEVERFVPLSHAHGGWAAMDIADTLGADRVPALLLMDLIMTPPPPEFAAGLRALQDERTWRAAQRGLLDSWLAGSTDQAVLDHVRYEAGGHGFDMWARSGRVIETAYATWGSPMGRLDKFTEPRPVRHIYSHPESAEYDAVHAEFRRTHPWFSYTRLDGHTHFPGIELPERVTTELFDLIGTQTPAT